MNKIYIKKIIKKIIGIVIIVVLFTGLIETFDIIVSNNLALGQLENETFNFITLTAYNNTIRPLIRTIYYVLIGWNSIGIIYNIGCLIKNFYNNFKGENTL